MNALLILLLTVDNQTSREGSKNLDKEKHTFTMCSDNHGLVNRSSAFICSSCDGNVIQPENLQSVDQSGSIYTPDIRQ